MARGHLFYARSRMRLQALPLAGGKSTVCLNYNMVHKGCRNTNCPGAHIAVGQGALDYLLNKRDQSRSQSPGGKGKGKDKGGGKDKGKCKGKGGKGGAKSG